MTESGFFLEDFPKICNNAGKIKDFEKDAGPSQDLDEIQHSPMPMNGGLHIGSRHCLMVFVAGIASAAST
jgi:hypothetical protein